MHHGVLGQKWGIRRYQDKNGRKINSYTSSSSGSKSVSVSQSEQYLKFRKQKESGQIDKEFLKNTVGSQYLSDFDNRYLQLGESFISEPEIGSRWVSNGNVYFESTASAMKKEDPLDMSDQSSMTSMLSHINPNYGQTGTTQNCTKCAAAVELEKLGYHNINAGTLNYPANADAFSYWFDGATRVPGDRESASRDISSMGSGASGVLTGSYYDSYGNRIGGHALHFDVLDSGVQIEDGQCGKTYSSIDDAANAYGFSDNDMSYTRLDTATPNLSHLAEDSVVTTRSNEVNMYWDRQSEPGHNDLLDGHVFAKAAANNSPSSPYDNTGLDGRYYSRTGQNTGNYQY